VCFALILLDRSIKTKTEKAHPHRFWSILISWVVVVVCLSSNVFVVGFSVADEEASAQRRAAWLLLPLLQTRVPASGFGGGSTGQVGWLAGPRRRSIDRSI
jgi:hypothetical protein